MAGAPRVHQAVNYDSPSLPSAAAAALEPIKGPAEPEGDLEADLASDVVPPAKKLNSKHELSLLLHLPDLGRLQQMLQDNGLDPLPFSYSHRRILPFPCLT